MFANYYKYVCKNIHLRTLLTTHILNIDYKETWFQIVFFQCLQYHIYVNEYKSMNLDINRQEIEGT